MIFLNEKEDERYETDNSYLTTSVIGIPVEEIIKIETEEIMIL